MCAQASVSACIATMYCNARSLRFLELSFTAILELSFTAMSTLLTMLSPFRILERSFTAMSTLLTTLGPFRILELSFTAMSTLPHGRGVEQALYAVRMWTSHDPTISC